MTKTEQIIAFIKASPTGRKFGEIQRFIVELNGRDYDEMVKNYKGQLVRKNRGYWCTRLLGGGCFGVYGKGALRNNGCTKIDGRWVYAAK